MIKKTPMSIKLKLIFTALIVVEIFLLGLLFLGDANFQLLDSKGPIAREQRNLMLLFVGTMLVVAIPLLTFLYTFAFKYKEKTNSKYTESSTPHWAIVLLWWAIPSVFVLFMAATTWSKTSELDPYRPLDSHVKPVKIQVVALDWKWLFLYPEYGIASVNFLQLPKDTPISFELTADAPMNSFWIPQLAGQIYAMTGMSTKLHLIADEAGDYRGQAAEINGDGYSGMNFVVRVSTKDEFKKWIDDIKRTKSALDAYTYDILSEPSGNFPITFYSSYESGLYDSIIAKFMSMKEPHNHNNH